MTTMPTRDELATAWDEGYAAAEHMAKCWGHVDSWEDEPSNPYRAAEPGVAVPEPDEQIVDTEYPCGCRAGWSPLGAFAVRCDNHAGPAASPVAVMCACGGRCGNAATETEHSPYMNDYCDDCTYTRCDVSFNMHAPPAQEGDQR